MTNLTVICASVFAISILLTGTITPGLLIQDADAVKSQGTFRSQVNSNAVCGDTLCSDSINSATGVITQPENTNADVELLFVQSSTSGTFDDGEQILTLVGISPATVYFSDRPNRITGFEDTESFVAMWSEGADSFASDPPNAVLEIRDNNEESDVFIIELMNPIYDANAKTLQYTIKILAEASDGLTQYDNRNDLQIPATFEDVVLFIDSEIDPCGLSAYFSCSSLPQVGNYLCPDSIPGVCDLSGKNLSGIDLPGVDLSGANLRGVNFYGTELGNANLSGADLSGANLSGAYLGYANLSGANLYNADLTNANLSNADLSGANLHGANFSGANLSGANLHSAKISFADLINENFSGADLSCVNHFICN